MKAEFSHSGFLNSAEYTSVKLQEGRMITDRDFNAGCEIPVSYTHLTLPTIYSV